MLSVIIILTVFCSVDITAFAADTITGLKQTAAVKTGFRVQWNQLSGKLSYDVKIEGGSKTLVYKKRKSNIFTITGKLSPATNYKVSVRARRGNKTGGWSSPKTVTTCCNDVTAKQTSFADRSVTLEWNAAAGAKGYRVYQKNINSNGSASYKHVGTTKKTKKKIKLPTLSESAYKETNVALIVVPVRKIAGYRAESRIKNVSKRAYVYYPKSTPFMVYTPYSDNYNNIILKSNARVSGFTFRIYSADDSLLDTRSISVENESTASFKYNASKVYKIDAQAYITVGSKTARTYWSSKTEICPKPEITYKWNSNAEMVVSWGKIDDVSGYNFKIQQSDNSSVVYRQKRLTENKLTITNQQLSGLEINKAYKITVLPFKDNEDSTTKFKSNSITTKKAEIIGHRGVMDKAPENTIVSFKKAKKAGYDSFECDFWETKSGDLLIYHDLMMDSCGKPNLDIRTIKAADIKKYPIKKGSNISSYATQYIPTMEQTIKLASKLGMKLYLHTKDSSLSVKGMQKINSWVKKYNMGSKLCIFSRSTACAAKLEKYIASNHGYLIDATSAEVIKNSILYMSRTSMKTLIMKRNSYLDKEISELAHSFGIKIACYGNKTPAHAAKVLNQGTDIVIVDKYFLKK